MPKKIPSDLVFMVDGVAAAKLVLDISIYWIGGLRENSDAVLGFYRQALKELPEIRHFMTETAEGYSAASSEALDLLPQWCLQETAPSDVRVLRLETAPVAGEPSEVAFVLHSVEYASYAAGMCALALPWSCGGECPDRVIQLARQVFALGDLYFGRAGYSINWDPAGPFACAIERRLVRMRRKFPGVNIPHIFCNVLGLRGGVLGSDWITFVGRSALSRLGGAAAVRRKLAASPEVAVDECGLGAILVAGSKPELGDVPNALSNYRAVASAIEDVRTREHPPFLRGRDGDFDPDLTSSYLGRFVDV